MEGARDALVQRTALELVMPTSRSGRTRFARLFVRVVTTVVVTVTTPCFQYAPLVGALVLVRFASLQA